jgi:hypothetical protein
VVTRGSGATVPKGALAVSPGSGGLEAVRPAEFPASCAAFHGDEGVVGEPALSAECEQDLPKIVVGHGVGRVQEDDVVRLPGGGAGEGGLRPRGAYVGAGQVEGADVLPQGTGRAGVGLDEQGMGGAPGERFEADGAGSGEQVGDPGAVERAAQ